MAGCPGIWIPEGTSEAAQKSHIFLAMDGTLYLLLT